MLQIGSAEEAKQNQEYRAALVALLFQLADDNFLVGYRGSEWLGLAPHLEADVAFSSIAQDHMGHAALFYQLLEELGEGKADDLAHLREASSFQNARLVERSNGKGDYMEHPQYDWCYSVVRQYIFDLFEQMRMNALQHSTYLPLAQAATKISREKYYHVLHGETWFKEMATTTDEARYRLLIALDKVWSDIGELFSWGPQAASICQHGLLDDEQLLLNTFTNQMSNIFDVVQIPWPGDLQLKGKEQNGRYGQHTVDLEEALKNISEVYRQDPTAAW
ncbi:1,2-phenylacetyl-CoA epoxidase subunit PaaC [Bacillus horti]|uniref:Ring-1,2-phenylacetyl-CoA epoxidase subunit PaaC n=1 Tax=Caldalkalibacillus horti TaxID=77523 RepID=A0ABT9W0D4_9BACI|nr:1,2-phenylacetyl-CoA epoxidase subunit PaaC [Bacillus horti]MDQ0166696.1 ring-1,2-phenylacetyl-CoA epoxidase subunit PaaC [Bacillus horti]